MAERLRALLEHPLDARVASAVVVLASAAMIGFAAVLALGLASAGSGSARGPAHLGRSAARPGKTSLASPSRPKRTGSTRARPLRQDPQDRPGTAAHARADRELAGHRALQHLPYRSAGVSVALVGARGGRAVLRVRAGSALAARRGWRRFLRRYGDRGGAYLPVFVGRRPKSRGEGS